MSWVAFNNQETKFKPPRNKTKQNHLRNFYNKKIEENKRKGRRKEVDIENDDPLCSKVMKTRHGKTDSGPLIKLP